MDGDRYEMTVTIGGHEVSTGANLPAGITAERAAELLLSGTGHLMRLVRAELDRQWRALEAAAKNDGTSDA